MNSLSVKLSALVEDDRPEAQRVEGERALVIAERMPSWSARPLELTAGGKQEAQPEAFSSVMG
jgi:hypothetical protein